MTNVEIMRKKLEDAIHTIQVQIDALKKEDKPVTIKEKEIAILKQQKELLEAKLNQLPKA